MSLSTVTDWTYTPEERERRRALMVNNNTCQRCDRTAYTLSREALMQLRPKRSNPDKKELLCGECCAKGDAKAKKKKLGKSARRAA